MVNMKRLNTLGWALLVIVVGTMLAYIKYLQGYTDTLEQSAATLASNLKSSVTVKGTRIEYKYRVKEQVKLRVLYLPPEGNLVMLQPKDGIDLSNSWWYRLSHTTVTNPETGEVVSVKKLGLCFGLALAGLVSSEMSVGLQSRVFYYNRWGAGIGISSAEYGYIFLDRRLEDFIPIFKNTTIGAHYGLGTNGDRYIGANLSLFF